MRALLVVLVAGFALLLAVGFGLKREMPVEDKPEDPNHVVIDIPQDHGYGGAGFGRQLDISPDGTRIAYVGNNNDYGRRLYTRKLGESAAPVIPGTDNGAEPVFSPDGRQLVFFAEGSLRKLDFDSSKVTEIGKTNSPRGIAWLDADTLVYGNTSGQLLRISATQGEPAPLLQYMGPHLPQLTPSVLPGGQAVIFTAANGSLSNNRIRVLSLKTGEERLLLDENAFAPRYVPTGHIVYATGVYTNGLERKLMAVRFDLQKLEVVGTPQPILETSLAGQGSGGSTDYAFSANGVLIYRPRIEESIDDVLAHIGNINLTKLDVQKNWFDQLKNLVR